MDEERKERELNRDGESLGRKTNGDEKEERRTDDHDRRGRYRDEEGRDDDEGRDRRRRRRRQHRSSDDNRDRRDDRPRFLSEKPRRVIVLRQLPLSTNEDEIRAALQIFGAPVKDVRLVRDRETGLSRGFAFVEFQFLPDAQRWMDSNQGQLIMNGQVVTLNYSNSRDQDDDWFCSQCGTHNFKRRGYCFKCSIPKDQSERFSEISKIPTKSLILMGLDTQTVEETVRKELVEITAVGMNIQVVRDPATNVSRGSCYVVVSTYEYAAQLLEILNNMNPAFTIDGKQVTAHYCRDNNDPMYTQQQQQWAAGSEYAAYYQQQQQQQAQYTEYMQQYYQQGGGEHKGHNADKMALAQEQVNAARRMQAQMGDTSGSSANGRRRADSGSSDHQYGASENAASGQASVPDTSQYQYDETSGYYYDSQTGLYYDPNSQYYYNAESQKYLYWDSEQQTYLPVPESASSGIQGDGGTEGTAENKEKKKKDEDKSKMAKKVAKDMARWAQSMNVNKTKDKKHLPTSSANELFSNASADAGFAMLSKKADPLETKETLRMANKDDDQNLIVASYGGESESDEETETTTTSPQQTTPSSSSPQQVQLTDWNKLICLLCKRQFPSREVLVKHQQFSDLHKQNLEKLGAQGGDETVSEIQYRDRAKERRDKFGPSEPPQPKKMRYKPPPPPVEEPTKFGIGADNIGNKMLQNMGWKSGSGLGKQRQGRTEIIQVERRTELAGLGVKGSRKRGTANSYRSAVKQAAQQRFMEIQQSEDYS